jgi:hypothetical protein
MSPKCLHPRILGRFANRFVNLTQQIIGSKDEIQIDARYTIGTPVMKKNSWSLTYLLAYVSKMSPRREWRTKRYWLARRRGLTANKKASVLWRLVHLCARSIFAAPICSTIAELFRIVRLLCMETSWRHTLATIPKIDVFLRTQET